MTAMIESTFEMLLQSARDSGMVLTGDYRVTETDAERLTGYSERSFRQMRDQKRAPPFYRIGNRYSYRLHDLAEWIEAARCMVQ
jgi:hypothetical protein